MTAQKGFFTLLQGFLNTHPGILEPHEMDQLATYVKTHRRALSTCYDYSIKFETLDGDAALYYLNFLGELVCKTFFWSKNSAPLLNIDISTLIKFLEKLALSSISWPFIKKCIQGNNNDDLFQFLVMCISLHYLNVNKSSETEKWKSTFNKAKSIITHLVNQYPNHLKIGHEHLLAAGLYNIPELVLLALKRGVSPECYQSNDGMTPLCLAAQEGALEAAKILVEIGHANINHQSPVDGRYPVWLIMEHAIPNDKKFEALLSYLLAQGANANLFVALDKNERRFINAWLKALQMGNFPLINILASYARPTLRRAIPVKIDVINDRMQNGYYFAVMSNSTGDEAMRLLEEHGVMVPALTSMAPENNLLTLGLRQASHPVLIKLMEYYSAHIASMQPHPLISYLHAIIHDRADTQRQFLPVLSYFLTKKLYLPFDTLVALCTLMMQQEAINHSFELELELAILLKHIASDRFFPTAAAQLADLMVLLEQYHCAQSTNTYLSRAYSGLAQRLQPYKEALDEQEKSVSLLRVKSYNALIAQTKLDAFLNSLITEFKNTDIKNLFLAWGKLLNVLRDPNEQLVLPKYLIHKLLKQTGFRLDDLSVDDADKMTLLNHMMTLTELSSAQKTVTHEDVSITRQYLPILKKHLFLYGKVNEVYAATSYEFMVEATYSPENHMRLFINEMDMYLYSSARFIKQGIGFKEVAEKLKIYGDKVAKKHQEIAHLTRGTEDKWYLKELTSQQISICFLLIHCNPDADTLKLVQNGIANMLSNQQLSGYKNDKFMQDNFLSILNRLLEFGELTIDYQSLLANLREKSRLFKNFPKVFAWLQESKAKQRQQKLAALREQPLRQLAVQAQEPSPFTPPTVTITEEAEDITDSSDDELDIETDTDSMSDISLKDHEDNFWEEPSTELEVIATTQASQSKSLTDESALLTSDEERKIKELFATELKNHGILGKKHKMVRLNYPGMKASYWGIFAADKNTCPRKVDGDTFDAMERNFDKAIVTRCGGGIHHDDGEFRIHPPGDWRLHGSNYQRKNDKGNPLVLIIFDEKFRNHKKYAATGFHTKNLQGPKVRS